MKMVLLYLMMILPLYGENHEKLLGLAKKWEVPQPHPKATLVKIWAYYNDSGDFYTLGFVEPGKPKQALVGFTYRRIDQPTSNPPIPVTNIDKLSLKFIAAASPFGSPNGANNGLLTAIQLIRHGHLKLGNQLLKKSLKTDAGHHASPFYIPENQPADSILARSCLAAAVNAITTPQPDFKQIRRRINTLTRDRPELKNKTTTWLVNSLTATIEHPKPPLGSIEALIDDYLMSGGVSGAMSSHRGENPAKKALVLKGFEAIPILIRHLDDKRMTNHLMQGFNNFTSYPMTADMVINHYLQTFANNEFGSSWLDRQQGLTSKKDAVAAWWKRASAMGERKYVRKNTLRKQKQRQVSISSELLLIAINRYPELLPEFYSALLKSKSPSWQIAEPLANHAQIPLETRKKLLLKGIITNSKNHRNSALSCLLDFDPKQAESILLKLLKKCPKTTKGEYWTDQNAYLARFVSESNNMVIWDTTHQLIQRADLGMRMELINHLKPPKNAPKQILKSFFTIYDRYSQDTTVRDEKSSSKFDGPCAGFPYTKIEFRNFVHRHFARWIKLKVQAPDRRYQTPKQWAQYRSTVHKALTNYRKKHGLLGN